MDPKLKLTYAMCSYNRADRLRKLVDAIREQECPIPYEILVVNNNSTDHTELELAELSTNPGATLRWVTETEQGIVAARNRCLIEAMSSDIMVFIDDDEIPLPGLLYAATDAICNEGAQVAGGKVVVDFTGQRRPKWLGDELLGFLAATDYGEAPFWVTSKDTPLWTANIAYDMKIFRENPDLRFDKRYDRQGKAIGGGEDVMMFGLLLNSAMKIRYRPDMTVLHSVEPWRLKPSYFLKLHFSSGFRSAYNCGIKYKRNFFGVPLFLFSQALKLFFLWLTLALKNQKLELRKCMNFTHALGQICGYFSRWKENPDYRI
ncbi:glycosyltransferase [Methylomonas sp. MED-D]|uniref:glycosyltransferase n=1 Tax=unclassified Methylomonas TaxID=2608980 RepID=UPI002478A7EF|nr:MULTISPECIES: glycosyltransferase [unclassified Methylomonas]MDT4331592.1 glycosyltransferase [Methylomonas sp. MV1]WGS84266.1 glycosyltransferase [Methylomonas sp. UP202]